MGVPLAARAFVLVTAAVGLAIAAVGAATAGSTSLPILALLGAAVVLTELLQVSNVEGASDPDQGHQFSFSSGVHIAAVVLLGPWIAALVAAFGVVTVDRLRGSPWLRVVFNASVFAAAAAAGGLVFEVLGGHRGVLELPSDFAALAGLAITYSAVNVALVSFIVALASARSPVAELPAQFRADLAPRAAEAGLGIAFAFCALTEPWAVAALLPVVWAVFQAHARLVLLRVETARALETFANVVDERDSHTYHHSSRVAELVGELATGLGLPPAEVARLTWAGRLHDLGKIAVDETLLRKPGRLSEVEWRSLRRHPRLSARILRRFRFAAEEARAIEHHHERFDGGGYYGIPPQHLTVGAHILIVADAFDAMTSERPYRPAKTEEEALAEIERASGAQFHPVVAKAFVALRRGLPPIEALSRDDRQELRKLMGRSRTAHRPSIAAHLNRWPEPLALVGLLVALAAAGFQQPAVVGAGVSVCTVALAARHFSQWRARRLVRSIRALAALASDRDVFFDNVAYRISTTSPLEWAGLLYWDEQTLEARVQRGWGDHFAYPNELALTSWLVRELDEYSPLIVGNGGEIGRTGSVVAIPLREGGSLKGFVVLVFSRHVGRHVSDALMRSTPLLPHALTRTADVRLLLPRAAATS